MAFQQGLSGLNSSAVNLDVISRNIANSNTVGYKAGSTQFADMFSRSVGGASGGAEVGIGARVSGINKQFAQGKLQTTENPLDLAINGEGFFKVVDDNSYVYSRNGQLRLNSTGYLVSNNDLHVRGYISPVKDPYGKVTGFETESDIQVDFSPLPATATTEIRMGLNLDADSLIKPGLPEIVPEGGVTPEMYSSSKTIPVRDSQGYSHELSVYFVKTEANNWNVYIAKDNEVGTTINEFGSLEFDTVGNLVTTSAGTIEEPSSILPLVGIPISVDTQELDVEDLDITLLFNDGNQVDPKPSVTQYASNFGVHQISIDGNASGAFVSLSVASNGIMTGLYTNGQTKDIAQILLAGFRDTQKMVSLGSNMYQATEAAGPEITNRPGEGSAGSLQAGALEGSNVDLTQELVNLIVAQRTYQANAQSVRAQSDLLQTLVQMA